MQKIKELYKKYRELVNYAIFGGATTVVNMIAYYLLMFVPFFASGMKMTVFGVEQDVGYLIANAIAFVVAVIFSYFMNREFVFANKVSGAKAIIAQFCTFFVTRLVSFGIEEVLLYVLVQGVGISEFIAKWPVAVLVVVINYAFGKLIVFKKHD